MTDERREIHRRARSIDIAQGLPDIERRGSAVAGNDSRDAHADEVLGAGLLGKIVGVGVDVDEAWRDDEPGGIDGLACVALRDYTDSGNATVLHGHIGAARSRAGAIHDLAACDHEVVPRLSLRGRPGGERPDEKNRGEDRVARHGANGHHATSRFVQRSIPINCMRRRALRDVARPGLSR